MQLAESLWGERFEVLVATHLDREHLHNHFVVNAVSFSDGKITKIKHVKILIEKILNDNKNKENIFKDGSSREKLNKKYDYLPKINNDNDKDISFDNIDIRINKSKQDKNDLNINKEKEEININNVK